MTIESEIVWETPPPAAEEVRVNRVDVLKASVVRPGEWARLGAWPKESTARQAASDARKGRTLKEYPPGEFEARVAADGDEWKVWVRFHAAPPTSTNGKGKH